MGLHRVCLLLAVNVFITTGFHTVNVCDLGSATLRCERGEIEILSAKYGRYSTSVCRDTKGLSVDHECRGTNETGAISQLCSGKMECNIAPQPSLFVCPSISKYLNVWYKCRIPSLSQAASEFRIEIDSTENSQKTTLRRMRTQGSCTYDWVCGECSTDCGAEPMRLCKAVRTDTDTDPCNLPVDRYESCSGWVKSCCNYPKTTANNRCVYTTDSQCQHVAPTLVGLPKWVETPATGQKLEAGEEVRVKCTFPGFTPYGLFARCLQNGSIAFYGPEGLTTVASKPACYPLGSTSPDICDISGTSVGLIGYLSQVTGTTRGQFLVNTATYPSSYISYEQKSTAVAAVSQSCVSGSSCQQICQGACSSISGVLTFPSSAANRPEYLLQCREGYTMVMPPADVAAGVNKYTVLCRSGGGIFQPSSPWWMWKATASNPTLARLATTAKGPTCVAKDFTTLPLPEPPTCLFNEDRIGPLPTSDIVFNYRLDPPLVVGAYRCSIVGYCNRPSVDGVTFQPDAGVFKHGTTITAVCSAVNTVTLGSVTCTGNVAEPFNPGTWSSATFDTRLCCTSPPSVSNGGFPGCTLPQSTCTLECNAGYDLVGSATYTCTTGPDFIGTGACSPKSCSEPPAAISNGQYLNCATAPHGATCTATCDSNYIGSGSAQCNFGTWTGATSCTACTSIPTVTNGNFPGCSVPTNSPCTLECNTDYNLVGDATYTCSGSNFIGTGTCAPKGCNTGPAATPNGQYLNCASAVHGATCTATCDSAFTASGSATCNFGSWTGVTTCTANLCVGVPSAGDFGTVQCNTATVAADQLCTVTCNTGYSIGGNFVCVAGSWSPPEVSNKCQPNPCPVLPTFPSGNIPTATCPEPSRVHGSQCVVQCDDGYQDNGGPATCDKGTWQFVKDPVCLMKQCWSSPAAVANGVWSVTLPANGGTYANLVCNSGYTLENPSAQAQCFEGAWKLSIGASCVPLPCLLSPPNPLNGQSDSCPNTPSGGVCGFTCNAGFIKSAESSVCTTGTWSTVTCVNASIANGCPRSSIPAAVHGTYQLDRCEETVPENSYCPIQCETNYIVSTQSLCVAKQWTVGGVCVEQLCNTQPAPIANGNFASCIGSRAGDTCSFTCSPGYQAQGSAVCQQGSWTGTPTCFIPPCVPNQYTTPPGATITCPPTPQNTDVCSVVCPDGTLLKGELRCNFGVWSSFSCDRADCDAPLPAIANAAPLCSLPIATGGSCSYSCNSLYTAGSLPPKATCYNSSWTFSGSCIKKTCADAPTPPDGNTDYPSSCAGLLVSDTCAATCKSTNYAPPSTPAVCSEGTNAGFWSSIGGCVRVPCGQAPPVINSDSVVCPELNGVVFSGDSCTVTCSNGYVQQGELKCTAGQFSTVQCAPQQCPTLPPADSQGSWGCAVPAASGSLCQFTCQSGFEVRDTPSTATCLLGNWTNIPVCRSAFCRNAPSAQQTPQNVQWNTIPATGVSQIGYTCDPGFVPDGFPNAVATCDRGVWSVDQSQIKCRLSGCINPPNPAALPNGTFANNCANAHINDECLVTCAAGFGKSGNIVCIGNDQWSYPTCTYIQPLDCKGQPDPITNGVFGNCDVVASGASCPLICDGGYTKSGDLQCNNGTYIGRENLRCNENGCPNPPADPASGMFARTCVNVAPQGVCVLTCSEGYTAGGNATCVRGSWVTSTALCIAKSCTTPPTITNGVLGGDCAGLTVWPHEKRCDVQCDTGRNSGGLQAVCTLGTFSNVVCEANPCPAAPVVPNGGFATSCANIGGNGGTCQVICNNGYVASTPDTAECNLGSWTRTPQCPPKPCPNVPLPQPNNGQYENCQNTPSGGECKVNCNTGYKPTGSAKCSLGNWDTSAAACIPLGCPLPAPQAPNAQTVNCGALQGTTAPDMTQCSVTCQVGYELIGGLSCSIYQWSQYTCKVTTCDGLPAIDNSIPNLNCQGTPHGGSCQVTCNTGYSLKGNAPVCLSRVWTGLPTCEPANCLTPPVDIFQGSWTLTLPTDGVPSGTKVSYSCNSGMEKSDPNAFATCINGGWTYSGRAACLPARCLTPPDPIPNGNPAVQCAPAPSGGVCNYICDFPYTPDGPAVCSRGQWTYPKCIQGASCITPPSPLPKGRYTCLAGRAGDKCSYTCNDRHYQLGETICQNAQWVEGAKCLPFICTTRPTPIPAIEGGYFTDACNSVQDGDKCPIVCEPGRTPQGEARCRLGVWIFTDVACVPKTCTTPAPIQNGDIKNCAAPVRDQQSCDVTCKSGTTLVGGLTCSKGAFTCAACYPSGCPSAPATANGKFPNCANIDGVNGKCAVQCDEGYTTAPGQEFARCSKSEWVSIPVCSPRECTASPSPVAQGKWQCVAGKSCTLVCNQGFTAINGVATCKLGVWTGDATATCQAKGCTDGPTYTPSNGIGFVDVDKCRGVSHGYACRVNCKTGFACRGDAVCKNGQWTTTYCLAETDSICKKRPADPENGRFDDCQRLESGKSCQLTCDAGYTAQGDAICRGGYYDLSKASCVPNGCSTTPADGAWDCTGKVTPHLGVCRRACTAGFTPQGEAVCIAGSWTTIGAQCVEVSCITSPPASLATGGTFDSKACASAPNGGTCTVLCNQGYASQPQRSFVTCRKGTWEGAALCSAIPCPLPNLVNAYAPSSCRNATSGTTCQVACSDGYESSAPLTLTCSNGAWDTKEIKCTPAPCKDLPQGRNFVANGCTAPVADGKTCDTVCKDGYQSAGSGNAKCSLGQWVLSGSTCIPKGCADPPAYTIQDGEWLNLQSCKGAKNQDTCDFKCSSGLKMSSKAICLKGEWTTESCKQIFPTDCTTPPPAFQDGFFKQCLSTKDGESCPYYCLEGYEPTNQDGAVCNSGTWDMSFVGCNGLGCTTLPPAVPFGQAWDSACANAKHGDACTLYCPSNMVKLGDAICTLGGWDMTNAVCQHKTCSSPSCANGYFPDCPSVSSHGQTCQVKCNPYFSPNRPSASCVDGVWDLPVCAPASCPAPPANPISGSYTCSSIAHGEKCTLKCASGYGKTGDAICSYGSYEGVGSTQPSLPICKPLPCLGAPTTIVQNGGWKCGTTESGTSCLLSCNEGYEASGNALCKLGRWVDTDRSCNPLRCKYPPLEPANGFYATAEQCRNTVSGGTCPLTCKKGYNPSPPAGATCTLGKWSNPTCLPSSCTVLPTIVNGFADPSCQNLASGKTCPAKCNPGFELSPANSQITCTAGEFVVTSKCVPESCRQLPTAIPLGTWACTIPVQSGGTCSATCATGYTATGSTVCTNGKWTNTQECVGKPCPQAPPAGATKNGAYGNCANTPHLGNCTLKCDAKFIKTRDAICRAGAWDLGQCIADPSYNDCRSPPPPSANGTYYPCAFTKNGQQCALNCKRGYNLVANATCKLGSWIPGVCLPRSCPTPPSAWRGGVTWDNCINTPHGGICKITSCRAKNQRGFAVCILGRWNYDQASCGYKPCVDLPKVPWASVRNCKPNSPHGTSCEVQCPFGFEKGGDATCRDGVWSVPYCQAVQCFSSPNAVSNGEFSPYCVGAGHGTVCPLACNQGYRSEGATVCTNGQWVGTNGVEPKCVGQSCSAKPPNTIQFGTWKCLSALDKQTCPLECAAGYVPSGEAVCRHGNWEDIARTCTPRSCPAKPSDPAYGSYISANCANAPHNARCELRCNSGYEPTDSAICKFGQWQLAGCRPVNCTTPPVVQNGNADTAGKVICNTGYRFATNDQTAICSKGTWAYIPSCVPMDCGHPPNAISKGTFTCSSALHLGECPLKCDSGYTKTNNAICRFGSWVGSPSCAPQKCVGLPVAPKGGFITVPSNCVNKANDEVCDVQCDPGLQLSKPVVCKAGEWTNDAQCIQRIDSTICVGPPSNPSDGVYADCKQTPSGGVCGLKCRAGYTYTNNQDQSATCVKGIWKATAQCKPSTCEGEPQPPTDGYITKPCKGAAHGRFCQYGCQRHLYGSGAVQCVDGNWVSTAKCVVPGCSMLPIIPGALSLCKPTSGNSFTNGALCYVLCFFDPRPRYATCIGGHWDVPSCHPTSCRLPPTPPANGNVTNPARCTNAIEQDRCSLQCSAGFIKSTDFVCNRGSWVSEGNSSRSPSCLPVGCSSQPPVDIPNGKWNCLRGQGTGDACPLQCASGYAPSGSAICVGNQWIQTAQKCLPKTCASGPSNPPYGTYDDCKNAPDGGVCTLSCASGWTKVSDARCAAGTWTLGSCTPAVCRTPPAIPNGFVDATCANVRGDQGGCAVQCNEGFSVYGDNRALCVNGLWKVIPVCRPKKCSVPPPVSNGDRWMCTEVESGSTCPLSCQSGYEPTGAASCLSGKWKDLPTCKPRSCGSAPRIPVGGTFTCPARNAKGDYDVGSVCKLDCKFGTKTGDAVCQAGTWTASSCKGAEGGCTAPPPEVKGGKSAACPFTANGGFCALECGGDTFKVRDSRCVDSKWVAGECHARQCLTPPVKTPANGFYSKSADCVAPQKECPFQCNTGYTRTGSVVCNLGEWDVSKATCTPNSCGDSPDVKGSKGGSKCQLPVPHGGSCKVECPTGSVSPAVSAQCVLGKWTPAECVTGCNALPLVPSPATVDKVCAPSREGFQCTVACPAGFTKSGDVTCRSGSWVPSNTFSSAPNTVQCIPNPCATSPSPVDNGSFGACVKTPSGGACALTCNAGFEKTGDAICKQGQWSKPTCKPVDKCQTVKCGIPSTLKQCVVSVRCNEGQCIFTYAPTGTQCDDNNSQTRRDVCDGKGGCQGSDLCAASRCKPSPPNGCTIGNKCDPNTGNCVSETKPNKTPCDDGNVNTIDDRCYNGVCVGTKDGGNPLTEPSRWGPTCCLVFSMFVNNYGEFKKRPLTAFEVTATKDGVNTKDYIVHISGGTTRGRRAVDIKFPDVTLKMGERVLFVSNRNTFSLYVSSVYRTVVQGLPSLEGGETLSLQKVSPGGVRFNVDSFPPGNGVQQQGSPNTPAYYTWQYGYAILSKYKGWMLYPNAFSLGMTPIQNYNRFNVSVFGQATCNCQSSKADTITNGVPFCQLNNGQMQSTFTTSADGWFYPSTYFGNEWSANPGFVNGAAGKWYCKATPIKNEVPLD